MRDGKARLRTAALALALAAAATALAACGDDESTGGGRDVVRPVVLEGTQLFPIQVMQDQGIAERHGLEIEPRKVAGPEALYTQMQAPGFQVGFGSWVKAAQLRAAGAKLTNVYSMYGYTNDVLVKRDSPIRDLDDLEGKRVGMFGGPGAGTTLMFRLAAKKFNGFDPQKDSKAFFGAPGLLGGQLERGQIDAALLLDPLVVKFLSGGRTRSVGNLGQIWRERTGQAPMLVAVQMNEEWASKDPDVAKRFVLALSEAQRYIKSHPDVWPSLAKGVGITKPADVALLRKRVAPALLDRWGDDFIRQQVEFSKQLVAAFGASKDFPERLPDGTFTTKFAPAP